MKLKMMGTILLILFIVSTNSMAYTAQRGEQEVRSFLNYRIKYVHSNAFNTSLTLPKSRVRDYTDEIIKWSNHYSEKFNVDVDPLLVAAILETETNFVSRADYDQGKSIGISSMKIDTAKWIAEKLEVDYNKWRKLDPTDLGIKFAVYYLALAQQLYDSDLNRTIISYNQGFTNANSKHSDELYHNYLFQVLGRYKFYKERINYYGGYASQHFEQLFLELE
ncbi:transglycosylase SLT domain-containing protein [Natroniella sulfidigena]|uniref:transglycosylase SLT domain-containing protein n=1 Tax=Natroniella sulfidigena TaxID=723921 RepID=UPI00200A9D7F|nr:transglycosylase SLT domain-containing protein [Natroniella sulfidigena]MCK8816809.1 transglycosylase SLT domain-containing protein [Natroniella sulfidigena]